MDAVPDGESRWSPAIWTASHAELFARFRELSDEAAMLSEEVRTFLEASRVNDAGLNVLDFGGGTGELVARSSRTHDRIVVFDQGRDPSTALAERGPAFDALVFSHVL